MENKPFKEYLDEAIENVKPVMGVGESDRLIKTMDIALLISQYKPINKEWINIIKKYTF